MEEEDTLPSKGLKPKPTPYKPPQRRRRPTTAKAPISHQENPYRFPQQYAATYQEQPAFLSLQALQHFLLQIVDRSQQQHGQELLRKQEELLLQQTEFQKQLAQAVMQQQERHNKEVLQQEARFQEQYQKATLEQQEEFNKQTLQAEKRWKSIFQKGMSQLQQDWQQKFLEQEKAHQERLLAIEQQRLEEAKAHAAALEKANGDLRQLVANHVVELGLIRQLLEKQKGEQ